MRYLVAGGAPWAVEAFKRHPDIGSWRYAGDEQSLRIGLMYNPRYVFFLNWSKKVGPTITERFECVNFHCTPLPYGRGGHPIENLILRGYTETVITAHRMTQEMDAGPIYGMWGGISLMGAKAEITARFVQPVASMMRFIVEDEPDARPQVGEPVLFSRLSQDAYEAVWDARG